MSTAGEKLWLRIGLVEKLCRTPMRPLTVKALLQSCKSNELTQIKTAEWIRQELTIRLAYRLQDFHRLAFFVLGNPYIKQCYDIHCNTLDVLLRIPPIKNRVEKCEFVEKLQGERQAQDITVDLMGQGLQQLRHLNSELSLDPFFERFFFFRIGRRLMIDHLVSLDNPQPNWSGCINLKCRPNVIVQECIHNVRQACRACYGVAPRITVTGNITCEFPFIADHLALIITEILKNALRATVEYHTLKDSDRRLIIPVCVHYSPLEFIEDDSDMPPVIVDIQKGAYDVVIRVSDKGGGIDPQRVANMFRFGYSTVAESQELIAGRNTLQGWIRSDMAGHGFGLPLSRAFARYFGGNIHLQPCLGVGTDAFVTISHVGNSEEPLFYDAKHALQAPSVIGAWKSTNTFLN